MNHSKIGIGILTTLISGHVLAGTMGPVQASSDLRGVASLSLGASWARGGDTQTFNLDPDIIKTYVANKSTNALVAGELFLGAQQTVYPNVQAQLGLAVAATGNAELQGIILDDANPLFDNYSYAYKINHTRVAVKGKLGYDAGYYVTPWVSASVGVGINRAHSFTNTPLIFEAVPNNNFSNHTHSDFSYTAGAGLQKSVNEHMQVGVGYEFADWGKSHLGRADGQTLNEGLSLNHLYTNSVLVNLTYLL